MGYLPVPAVTSTKRCGSTSWFGTESLKRTLPSFCNRFAKRLGFVLVLCCVVFLLCTGARQGETEISSKPLPPLIRRRIFYQPGAGGSWRIPESWLHNVTDLPEHINPTPATILEAAQLAAYLAKADSRRMIPHTEIPLIIHQTWKTTRAQQWPDAMLDCVESWLWAAEPPSSDMSDVQLRKTIPDHTVWNWTQGEDAAFFMWDDDGMDNAIKTLWPQWHEGYRRLPANVMRADTFRIFVLKWFGGVYADADTKPLRRPSQWVNSTDVTSWRDPINGELHPVEPNTPIRLLVGIEADTPVDSDSYWRMGYDHPVELTQWALAGAAGHPAFSNMLESVAKAADQMASEGTLQGADALQLTGPYRWTNVLIDYVEEEGQYNWNSLSGLQDGGRSKTVRDVLVLPITGFSPGRPEGYGNMGSKPITHHDARLVHLAKGSWKHFSLRVEAGKACRTLLGLCRNWSKVP
ncbi:uncharacterized protein SPPG_03556 [Spizellomyces punctatus DAOM BR117]|uniref:Initiation-specific alpha-1,6-mannosyltransferase n=1 Tax=Spizellomyces punctatus (strain DAOM BR117) TaxID=645134 RepID=A0A0L0HLS9_SPIPD|nr:uncharacterized protein SPPG_03556 [Spizellomyces punctatus DAOM BR117]KND01764.1 hypothetical protein SPPG_03556 [Spizellomyces punctatus DAOM BR117]|eukprot:XP_016609803.1 hypothetical protein SPPG_03556 [Spizellomyces punctatus DAOM BR117]